MTTAEVGPARHPTTFARLREETEITEAVGDQLKSTRATADSWQKGVAGLVGTVTAILLLKGPESVDKIDHTYVIVAAVMLGLAGALALLSTYLLLDAAYGTPARTDLEQIRQKSLYLWRYEQATDAAGKLNYGLWAVLISVVLVGATVIMIWFAPSPTAKPAYHVIDRTQHCGQLQKADNGQFKIVQDGKLVTVIPRSAIPALRLVITCP